MRIFYIEGPDLSGKTTLITKLQKIFLNIGLNCETLKEPSGLTRQLILNSSEYLCPTAERLYFLANHINVLSQANLMTLAPNHIVLIDRSAIVSDYVQMESTESKNHIDYIEKVRPVITDTDITKAKKGLILLSAQKETIEYRSNKRKTVNDKNDIKGLDFKIKIAEEYSKVKENKDLISYFDSFKEFKSEDNDLATKVAKHILNNLEIESLNEKIVDYVLK